MVILADKGPLVIRVEHLRPDTEGREGFVEASRIEVPFGEFRIMGPGVPKRWRVIIEEG